MDIIKDTKSATRRVSAVNRPHPDLHQAHHRERISLWYSGQKVELSVEAWIRGH